MTLRLAALASGTGSNVEAILKHIADNRLDARLELVLSNEPGAAVVEKARAWGVPVWSGDHRACPDRESFDRAMLAAVQEAGADTVVLAGYMRLLSPLFVQAFAGRILNIHPALLPSFPGLHGVGDALDYGVHFTGPTVHFVDEVMDHGPVIIQGVVPVTALDTPESLLPRIQALEHRIFSQALQWLAEGRLKLEGRRVFLTPGKHPPIAPASFGQSPLGPWMVCPALEGF